MYLCKKRHKSVACVVVTNISERKGILKKQGRCFICLKRSHIAKNCDSKRGCSNCSQRHHSSLCRANETQASGNSLAGVTQPLTQEIGQPSSAISMYAQDEIACFRISETWRKHAVPWFRYIYVLQKRDNSNLRDSVTSLERKCQVMFPSYLSQQISAVVRFRHVSANGSAVVCYIYQNTNARWFFEQQ